MGLEDDKKPYNWTKDFLIADRKLYLRFEGYGFYCLTGIKNQKSIHVIEFSIAIL